MTDDQIIQQALSILEARLSAPGAEIFNATDAKHYVALKLADTEREVFAVLLLDARHRVIEYRELFYGTIDHATVHPREVVKAALQANAAALILAHNHPSQSPDASDADTRITERLRDLLEVLDVRLLDHLIVGGTEVTSLAEEGLI